MTEAPQIGRAQAAGRAVLFVVLLGAVSLFADATYEGARSVLGPYFEQLAAGIVFTGALAGLGEAAAYALRVVSGYVADRTGAYWTFTFLGYAVNLGAVPLLALAGNWELAAVLVLAERLGKALRVPARDTLLATASHRLGYGTAFGIHELLDQIGAVGGPIWVAVALGITGELQAAFAWLGLPAALALAALLWARVWWGRNVGRADRPGATTEHTEGDEVDQPAAVRRAARFRLFCAFVFLTNVAFASWMFLGYHFKGTLGIGPTWIAIVYAVAMGVDAVAAVPLGTLFDRLGTRILVAAPLLGAAASAAAFLAPGFPVALVAATLWGLAMSMQETVFKAVVPLLVGEKRRATAYGWVQANQGIGWLVGAGVLGTVYQTVGTVACAALAGAVGLAAAGLAGKGVT